jgi:hypothetical protein
LILVYLRAVEIRNVSHAERARRVPPLDDASMIRGLRVDRPPINDEIIEMFA